ncbi:hypothetical protein NM688_g4052 [Phlebia brevispora]|uniref:Uncharacterized protein n=1 Tax=Phlebia brevispora TaxID=194682 RepID=A0ACC1T400_9APHY|nr:hypothetical protein NM688_g4052 [Phlebia brevispora]
MANKRPASPTVIDHQPPTIRRRTSQTPALHTAPEYQLVWPSSPGQVEADLPANPFAYRSRSTSASTPHMNRHGDPVSLGTNPEHNERTQPQATRLPRRMQASSVSQSGVGERTFASDHVDDEEHAEADAGSPTPHAEANEGSATAHSGRKKEKNEAIIIHEQLIEAARETLSHISEHFYMSKMTLTTSVETNVFTSTSILAIE